MRKRRKTISNVDKKAVIYCRVSSIKQTKGDGLNSQATRCEEFARYKNYVVEKTFTDDMSGSVINRPGMQAMLKHLRKHRHEPRVVLIDDISRLARGIEAHLQLRDAIARAGATLESPSIEFGEDSDSILVENLLASVSQHQRQKNGEQTVNRMKARLMNGYWPFQAPVGYRYEAARGRGKVLVPDEPIASILKEMLEGFADGRFQIQAEAKRFLERCPEFPKDLPNGEIRNQRVTNLLTRVTYAGYVEHENWNVSLRKGQHQGLISFETYTKIQQRLRDGAKVPARKDLSTDFPLRGAVVCGHCNTPLTACWSKSSTGKRYPYYLCPKRGCESYGKSIRRDRLEGEFTTLLGKLSPAPELFKVAAAMFKDIWMSGIGAQEARKQSLKTQLRKADKQVNQLLERIVEAESPTVIRAYEKRIQELEQDKLTVQEQIATCGRPVRDFDDTLRTALRFLAKPRQLWDSDRLADKRAVLKLTFTDRLAYVRNEGFRTPETTLPFSVLGGFHGPKGEMARPARFERATAWFVACLSGL